MRLAEVLFFYACMGVAVALQIRAGSRVLPFLLWPLFLPSLLSPAEERFETAPRAAPTSAIAAVFQRLNEALALWEHHLPVPMHGTERALIELDRRRTALASLLARPENRVEPGAEPPHAAAAQRHRNLVALVQLHDQLSQEIDGALARMDELATRIQLAHFSGRPMDDVARQLADLNRAVEGIQSVHDELDRDLRSPAA
jgi:hypothetical protein